MPWQRSPHAARQLRSVHAGRGERVASAPRGAPFHPSARETTPPGRVTPRDHAGADGVVRGIMVFAAFWRLGSNTAPGRGSAPGHQAPDNSSVSGTGQRGWEGSALERA